MKILQVYKDMYPPVNGGIERYIHDLSRHLGRSGHEVSVLVASREPALRSRGVIRDGIPTIETPCLFRLLSNPVCLGLGGLVRRSGADVIHYHHPLPAATLSWFFSRPQVPHVVTYHSDIVRQAAFVPALAPFMRAFLRSASAILATSPAYAGTSPFLRDARNVRVVPLGVDTAKFSPGPSSRRDSYFIFVGRFRSYKGIPVLLEAWRQLEGIRLVMVGGGPLKAEAVETCARHSLDVEFAGDLDDSDLVDLYRGARALILPSIARSEAFGMVQLEAMACGVPVISTNLPTGVPWVNRDGVTGIVVPPGDAGGLGTAVRRMLDDAARDVLARGALERARSEFDQETLFGQVEEILMNAGTRGL
jgi:glycosyltransferase involved in cell wall biosynthesis